jgi:hypothetical protein
VNSRKNIRPTNKPGSTESAQAKRAEREKVMSIYQRKLYEHIASATQARLNCIAEENRTGEPHDSTLKHTETIETFIEEFMPSGSGVDNGVTFDFEKSNGEKLVFNFGFHHMDENGMYSGWTEHVLTVKPSLQFGIELTISGRNRNDIKEYLHELFHSALTDLIDYDKEKSRYFSPKLRAASEAFKAQENKLGN